MQAMAADRTPIPLLSRESMENSEEWDVPKISPERSFYALTEKKKALDEEKVSLAKEKNEAQEALGQLNRKKIRLNDALYVYPLGLVFGAIIWAVLRYFEFETLSQIAFHTMFIFPIFALTDSVVDQKKPEKNIQSCLNGPAVFGAYISYILVMGVACWLPIGWGLRLFFDLSKETFWNVPTKISLISLIPAVFTWICFLISRVSFGRVYKVAEQKYDTAATNLQSCENAVDEVSHAIYLIRLGIHERTVRFANEYTPYDYQERDFDDEGDDDSLPIEYEDNELFEKIES